MKKITKTLLLVSIFILSLNTNAAQLAFVTASNSEFARPHDLVIGPDQKYLYVTDMNHDVIKVLDPKSLKTLSVIGEGELKVPHDVDFDISGNLLVADSGNNRIAIYAINGLKGKLMGELTESMGGPEGVSIDGAGSIYVANAGSNQILKFSGDKLLKKMGRYGHGRKEFIRAHDIEYHKGKLYIGDPGNNRIQIVDENLGFVSFFTPVNPQLHEPKYLALDVKSRVYIADQYNNMLRVFDIDGSEIQRVKKAGDSELNKIEGVEVKDNYVWISDTYNDRIVLFKWQ